MIRVPDAATERLAGRRGQLVLVAAGVIAVALVPMLVAYLQLGYAGDVAASEDYTAPTRNVERVLERSVDNASQGVPAEYTWDDRRDAVAATRSRLSPALDSLRTARLDRGTVYRVGYNQSRAQAWANRQCPGGPDRQFGPCRAVDGVVVQDRAGRTHVVAVAFDLVVTSDDRHVEKTLVVRPVVS